MMIVQSCQTVTHDMTLRELALAMLLKNIMTLISQTVVRKLQLTTK